MVAIVVVAFIWIKGEDWFIIRSSFGFFDGYLPRVALNSGPKSRNVCIYNVLSCFCWALMSGSLHNKLWPSRRPCAWHIYHPSDSIHSVAFLIVITLSLDANESCMWAHKSPGQQETIEVGNGHIFSLGVFARSSGKVQTSRTTRMSNFVIKLWTSVCASSGTFSMDLSSDRKGRKKPRPKMHPISNEYVNNII